MTVDTYVLQRNRVTAALDELWIASWRWPRYPDCSRSAQIEYSQAAAYARSVLELPIPFLDDGSRLSRCMREDSTAIESIQLALESSRRDNLYMLEEDLRSYGALSRSCRRAASAAGATVALADPTSIGHGGFGPPLSCRIRPAARP